MLPSESIVFMIMCMTLLRAYARHTDRKTRIALVSIGFVAVHLIHSLLSSEPLVLATGSFSSAPVATLQKSKHYASVGDAALIIFYNLFIPHGDDGAENAINVIKDQMGQVSSALYRLENAVAAREEEKRGVVYYNLIGNEAAFPSNAMSDLCHQLHPRLDCEMMQHYEKATESVTLTSLYEFCHEVEDATRTRVVYLHSKGSYHDHGKQAPWRQELTNSSLYPDCLYPSDDNCDVCGAQYYTMFASMFPGNMWTAKCSYIQKLLPPVEGGEYERRREEAIKQFFILRAEGIAQNTLGFHQDVFYGLDRYQWEHWIGSHPSINPCDMHSPNMGFWDMVEGNVRREHYQWGMGPRRSMIFDKPGERKPYLTNNEDSNFRQYYFLAGSMVKWLSLYDTVPTQDSWVWNAFPAGQKWKDLAEQHGKNALNAMIRGSEPKFPSAFASDHSENRELPMQAFDEKSSSPPVVVFYQISIPSGDKEKALSAVRAQFEVLSLGQYDHVADSFHHSPEILVYYTISGGSLQESDFVTNLCKEKSRNNIICQPLGTHDSDFTNGETLSQLHTFCKAKPSSNVVYISNQLVGYEENNEDLTKIIKATTSAVMSKMCQVSEDVCNVCGTEFYPLPFVHFRSNMFSASCGYVKDLMTPRAHEKEMYNIAGDAFLALLRKQFTTEIVKFTPRILGLNQHSVEHWVGSHPDLKPCDVGTLKIDESGKTIQGQTELLLWALAPRRDSAPPGYLSGDKESQFRLNRGAAFREYYYLAGNVFRWHRLYNKVPDASSWVWKWRGFPDGRLWEVAAQTSGADAVNVIAKQLNSDLKEDWKE